jgi:class 3 adenylate cyclase/tetratricopeptide (TPR) repeat protein
MSANTPHSRAAYIAQDRRIAVAAALELPEWAYGSVLFADISGFTPLSAALARAQGLRRGAEVLTRLLNDLYTRLIADVEQQGGSVVGFSGDAITCWFGAGAAPAETLGDAPVRAAAAAHAMQRTLRDFGAYAALVDATLTIRIAIKIAIASGRVRRAVVGAPQIQLLEVVAGEVVDRMALGEQLAHAGETLADEPTLRALTPLLGDKSPDWRGPQSARFAPLPPAAAEHLAVAENPPLPAVDAAGWIHPAIAPLLRAGQARFLAELRPATALFVRFGGINFESDANAIARLDGYMRWVQQIVQRYEGLLVQLTTGDKGSYFYAAFGAPLAHDDDAARAAAAALDLLHPPPTMADIGPMQLGISSGIMRIGAYGGPTRCTYGVLGDEVNVAARLMIMAAPGQILVTEAVAHALGDAMTVIPLGAHPIKGKMMALSLFAVQGRSDQPAAQRMRLYAAPLVGRAAELAPFVDALQQVVERPEARGRLLLLQGPAGIGKSHMAATLVQRAEMLDLRALHAVCQSTARAIPFFAARQFVRGLLALPAAASTHAVEVAVAQLLPDAAERAPLLADLLDIPMNDSPLTAGLEPRVRQDARSALTLALIAASAQKRPLLIVIEDAHWIDEASRDIVLQLAGSLPSATALLLVQRPPESEEESLLRDFAPAECVTVEVGELSPAATAALVLQRLGGPVEALASEVIHAQTQGNPFFVEELVTALRDAGRLERGPAGWRLSERTVTSLRAAHCLADGPDAPHLSANAPLALVDLGVPDSVQGVVLARLDRLTETARLALKVASVIGRTFALDILQAVRPLQSREQEVQRALEQVLARDFVRADAAEEPNASSAAPTYLFKHNIIRDVAYYTLLGEQQRELHLAVGEAIEALRPSNVEELAHHFHHSDTTLPAVRSRALDYLGRAAKRAQSEYANDTALLYYGRAAALEAHAPFLVGQVETLAILGRREQQYALLTRLDAAPDLSPADRARLWGDYYESIADYAQATEALITGMNACADDPIAQAQCRNRLGMIAWRQADYGNAETHFTTAHTLCADHQAAQGPSHGAAAEIANSHYGMGLVHRQLGRYEEARAAFGKDLAWQRNDGTRDREARVRTALGHLESIAGNHPQALEAYAGALAVHKAIGDRAGIGASLLAMAQAYSSLGDYAQALPLLEEALEVQQSIQNRFDEWLIWNELGILHWLVGHFTEAENALRTGLAVSRAIESDFGAAYLLCNLGQVQRDAGQLHEGAATLRAALELALAQRDTALEATCHGDLALTLLALHEPAPALAEATLAEELFTQLEQDDALTAVFATQAHAYLALGNAEATLDAARRGIANLAAHGGDYFPHRDGFWCAQALAACGANDEARAAEETAAQALQVRAERISNAEMRSSYLNNIAVNRAIMQGLGESTQPVA